MEKITYASLGSLGESFHQEFEGAVGRVKGELGKIHPISIGGKAKWSASVFSDVSPANTRVVIGKFQKGSAGDAAKAIQAAQKAFPSWRDLGWPRRITFLRKAAQIMQERQYDLAALLCLEVGKNRFEAIAEVSESVDLILYYCSQMEENHGFEKSVQGGEGEKTGSVLKPYGAWAVISPFNFPLALATGMSAGALIAGNTVVLKPSSDAPLTGLKLYQIFQEADLPEGVINFVTGVGNAIGKVFLNHPAVDGLIFTGSHAVGMNLLKNFSKGQARPCIAEMGGKNPAIIMPSANLDDAAEGVMRSAFGMGGEKCSACSRAYVHKDVYPPFLDALIQKTKNIRIGDPLAKETFLGPLINSNAVKKFQRAVALGRRQGRVVCGGKLLKEGDFRNGWFVAPTLVDHLPGSSKMFREEFFAPVLALAEVKNLDEALVLANQGDYGLTAGIFTQEEGEKKYFFDRIEAGVAYCNRRGGATTGAWPGVQSFGGWKGSGSSGKNALGPYYVAQFMREQSQTEMRG